MPILTVTQGLYTRALSVKSAVPHPKIMGIIRECGGKMHMSEGKQGMTPCSSSHTPADQSQKTGRRHNEIFSILSAAMMKQAHCNEYRC